MARILHLSKPEQWFYVNTSEILLIVLQGRVPSQALLIVLGFMDLIGFRIKIIQILNIAFL